MSILIACFGNLLRGDDGVGVVVADRLQADPLPADVQVLDVGIGGIHLVQELMAPGRRIDALILVDAVDLGRPPGTVLVLEPELVDLDALSAARRRDVLADMHYATPERACLLARGLGVLPDQTVMVGCQLRNDDRLGEGLSPEIEAAVDAMVSEVRRVVSGISGQGG